MSRRKQLRKWGSTLLIVVFVVGWVMAAGSVLYCAVTPYCDSISSGWWEVFLAIVAIPIVVIQLFTLRETIEEGILEPKADFGIAMVHSIEPEFLASDSLPKATNLPLSPLAMLVKKVNSEPELFSMAQSSITNKFFPIRILLKNTGKRALRFMKISVSLKEYPDGIQPRIGIKGYELQPDRATLVFRGKVDHIIYPGDHEKYQLMLGPSEVEKYFNVLKRAFNLDHEPDIRDVFRPGEYRFVCTLWAEGLNEPVNQELVLEIADDVKEVGQLKTYNSSKYGFETAEDRKRQKEDEKEKAKRLEQEEGARILKAESVAKQLDPDIQDILSDYVWACERDYYTITYGGKNEWSVMNAPGSREQYVIGVSVHVDEQETYLKITKYRAGARPLPDPTNDRVLNETDKLCSVLEEVTALPVKTESIRAPIIMPDLDEEV